MKVQEVASLVLLVLGAAGCSSKSTPAGKADSGNPSQTDSGGDTGSAPSDASGETGPTDAGLDSSIPSEVGTPDAPPGDGGNPLVELASCLGMSQPLTIGGQMPYVSVAVTAGGGADGGVDGGADGGTESGEFVLDFASTYSSIDLTAFTTTPVTSMCDPTMLFEVCTLPTFSFFGPQGPVLLTTESFAGVGGSVRQAGIIATDFLSEGIFTLAYGAGEVFDATSTSFCSNAAMTQAGFAPLTTKGYYENDLSLLVPYTTVDSNGEANTTVEDVPTVSVQIAGAPALAQLDTGFDDSVTKYSVNINEAFLAAIQAKNPNALVRDTTLDEMLTTCVNNVSEPVLGYRLASGISFGFAGAGGTVVRSYPDAVIFVKDTPAAAANCGGIGVWTVPAAQVAASFYNDMGIIAFDPYHEQVWIPTN